MRRLPPLLAIALLCACTQEQLYATGRNVQRAECAKRADADDRERCYRDADTSYGTYQRESPGKAR